MEENVKECLSLAEIFVEKHRTRRAILLYQDVIRLDNKNETAYLGIGKVMHKIYNMYSGNYLN